MSIKAKINHIQSGISKWYIKEIAPMGWKTTVFAPILPIATTNLIKRYEGIISLLMDEDGYIDIETLYKDYAEILSKRGIVTVFGINFNNQDLEVLYEAIKAEIPPKP